MYNLIQINNLCLTTKTKELDNLYQDDHFNINNNIQLSKDAIFLLVIFSYHFIHKYTVLSNNLPSIRNIISYKA